MLNKVFYNTYIYSYLKYGYQSGLDEHFKISKNEQFANIKRYANQTKQKIKNNKPKVKKKPKEKESKFGTNTNTRVIKMYFG